MRRVHPVSFLVVNHRGRVRQLQSFEQVRARNYLVVLHGNADLFRDDHTDPGRFLSDRFSVLLHELIRDLVGIEFQKSPGLFEVICKRRRELR